MKKRLIKVIEQIIELLESTSFSEKAEWFREQRDYLDKLDMKSHDFIIIIKNLKRMMVGMGSFTDLPLTPKDASVSRESLRDKQWDLAEELGEIIGKILH